MMSGLNHGLHIIGWNFNMNIILYDELINELFAWKRKLSTLTPALGSMNSINRVQRLIEELKGSRTDFLAGAQSTNAMTASRAETILSDEIQPDGSLRDADQRIRFPVTDNFESNEIGLNGILKLSEMKALVYWMQTHDTNYK